MRAMQVHDHEALDLLRLIAHCTHRPHRLSPAPVRLHQRQAPKALRLGQTRKIGELRRIDQPLPRFRTGASTIPIAKVLTSAHSWCRRGPWPHPC